MNDITIYIDGQQWVVPSTKKPELINWLRTNAHSTTNQQPKIISNSMQSDHRQLILENFNCGYNHE